MSKDQEPPSLINILFIVTHAIEDFVAAAATFSDSDEDLDTAPVVIPSVELLGSVSH